MINDKNILIIVRGRKTEQVEATLFDTAEKAVGSINCGFTTETRGQGQYS